MMWSNCGHSYDLVCFVNLVVMVILMSWPCSYGHSYDLVCSTNFVVVVILMT